MKRYVIIAFYELGFIFVCKPTFVLLSFVLFLEEGLLTSVSITCHNVLKYVLNSKEQDNNSILQVGYVFSRSFIAIVKGGRLNSTGLIQVLECKKLLILAKL